MKAYDSMSRDFLIKTLRRHGYSEQFVRTLQALNDGTNARFLVNGFKSQRVKITGTIRQGCPLAPLLFILALSTL
ncbi:hypothetical protein PI125_g23896 [Phytophthora idaei]|nr:hypothetical protein PI125_g23896 [Phytophthora idaei]